MERRDNPVPQFVGDDPEICGGDFLDGLVRDLDRDFAQKQLVEETGSDNFRGRTIQPSQKIVEETA